MKSIHAALHTVRLTLIVFSVLALNMGGVAALELSDLHIPMTLDEADTTLSKDYEIAVMKDGSVRRTWKLSDKTVFVDFNTTTQEAVLIAVIYDHAVPRKQGEADAHTIAAGKYDKETKWTPPKNAEARDMVRDTLGLENALRKKLNDQSMLFVETDAKRRKIVRVSLFSRMPSTNRWTLTPIGQRDKATAMGNQMTPEHVKAMYKDEERRRAIPLKSAVAATDDAADSATTESNSTVTLRMRRPTATKPQKVQPKTSDVGTTAMGSTLGSGKTASSGSAEKVRIKLDKGQRASEKMNFLASPPDWLKKVGVKNPTWWHYGVIGAVALLLIISALRGMSHAMSRASRRQQFNKVLRQASTQGNVKLRK